MSRTARIEKALKAKPQRKPKIPSESYLSLGCSVLNVAVSKRADGGVAKGQYIWYVGESESGKTWFAMQLLAEACRNSNFDDYRLIFDDGENGALMEIAKYFGSKLEKRIEPPQGTRANPRFSQTIEQFHYNVKKAVTAGPCIYVLDSMDSIDTEDDAAKEDAEDAARLKGKVVTGTMGMSKAKENSAKIKRQINRIAKNGSILVIISQVRERPGGYGGKVTSGGLAMRFFAHVQLWTRIVESLKRHVLKKDREYGKLVEVAVRKNRITGQHGKVELDFITDVGFDDTGSSVDYLVGEKHWSKVNGKIRAPEYRFKGPREKLIQKIESSEQRQLRLTNLVQSVWRQIAEATKLKRKQRYE